MKYDAYIFLSFVKVRADITVITNRKVYTFMINEPKSMPKSLLRFCFWDFQIHVPRLAVKCWNKIDKL